MSVAVDCRNLKGSLTVPYSKSMVHRYLFGCFLAGKYDEIKKFANSAQNGYQIVGDNRKKENIDVQNGYQISEDIRATINCLLELSQGKTPCVLPCCESGTTFRFVLALAAALGTRAEIIPSGSLLNRPIQELKDELNRHGAEIVCENSDANNLTYKIFGKLKPGEYHLPGNISSQFISALLLILPILDGDSKIIIEGEIESFPYVNLTLKTLEYFNIKFDQSIEMSNIEKNIENLNSVDDLIEKKVYKIYGNQKYIYSEDSKQLLEGDWSAASLWQVANKILGNSLEINGLDEATEQADVMIMDLLEIVDDLDVYVSVNDCPDLASAIALWALFRNAKTVITDTKRLKIKESNRQTSIIDLLKYVGAKTKLKDDNIVIANDEDAQKKQIFPLICSSKDHRIVMLASFLSLIVNDNVIIEHPECVDKSYPNFFNEIRRLGGTVV